MGLEKLLFNAPAPIRDMGINAYGYLLYRKRFGNPVYQEFYAQLMRNLEKPAGQIREEQFATLKQTLVQAYDRIPFYRDLFDGCGFAPREFSDVSQLQMIPLLTKDIIRENFDRMYDPAAPKGTYRLHSTSGSTGAKLKFYIPNDLFFARNAAFSSRFYGSAGVMPGERRVTLGGRIFTQRPPFWSFNRFENQLLLSSHHLNKNTVGDYIRKIEEFKPAFIQGHPNSILVLAQAMLSSGHRFGVALKGIFTTGETLIEANRDIIQEAFGTIVLQQYGSGESCFSAQEKPGVKGYVLNYEHGYVEMEGAGEQKEVIATSFLNPVMPLIRYKVGDLVKPSTATGPDNFPVLFDEVIGRVDDMLTDCDASAVLPVTLRMSVKPYLPEHTNYQLLQTAVGSYELILLDPDKKIRHADLVQELKKILGSRADIPVSYTDSLITEGGKVRNIINRMKR